MKCGCRIDIQECTALGKADRHKALFETESPELDRFDTLVRVGSYGPIDKSMRQFPRQQTLIAEVQGTTYGQQETLMHIKIL